MTDFRDRLIQMLFGQHAPSLTMSDVERIQHELRSEGKEGDYWRQAVLRESLFLHYDPHYYD